VSQSAQPIWIACVYLSGRLTEPRLIFYSKGECKMKTPKTISGWCMWLFFLWFGIGAFVSLPLQGTIAGILALGYAVFVFIGK
jgi:hypothetical protein